MIGFSIKFVVGLLNCNFSFGQLFGLFQVKRKMKCKKWFLTVILLLCLLVSISVSLSASALSLSTYDHLPGTNSIVNNLLSFIPLNNDYVCFCDSDYSYYIYYSDPGSLSYENGSLIGDDLFYIHYYRVSSGQFGAFEWLYSFGSGSLNLSVDHVVSSNLSFDLSSRNWQYSQSNFYFAFSVFGFILCVFVIFKSVRGLFRGGSV